MPYVQVWVDEEPCDGSCVDARNVERLEGVIMEAISLIRTVDAAAALCVLTGDNSVPMKTPKEIENAYRAWQKNSLPGFTNYNHN